jgi:cell shape-determining protein MreC
MAAYFIIVVVVFILWSSGSWLNQYSFSYLSGLTASLSNFTRISLYTSLDEQFGNAQENQLAKENLALLQENVFLKEKIRSNAIQLEDNDLKTNYFLTEAKVIGRDSFFNVPIIHVLSGTDRGIRDGLPVLNSNGVLIGTIGSSQEKTSKVILTPNHESRIGARIAGTDWDGIVEGSRDLRAVLEMLPLESKVEAKNQVVTNNRNPDIPEGLLIGTVALIKESDDYLFNEAVLDLPWNSKNLDKVWIITGRK